MDNMDEVAEKILVVDDDARLRPRLVRAFRDRGYRVVDASAVHDALEVVRADLGDPPDKAVLDLRMEDGSGLELLVELLKLVPDLQVVMLTGYGSIATAVDAVKLGAVDYLSKPADVDMILAAFARNQAPPLAPSPDYEPPSLARAEWEHIQRVLEDCAGNVSLAARKLGLHRRTLQRKLQKYPPRT